MIWIASTFDSREQGRTFTLVNKRLRLRIKIDDAMTDAETPLRFLKNSFPAHKAVRNLS